jgi:hypothetical protein
MPPLTKREKAHLYYLKNRKRYAEYTRNFRAKRLASDGISYTTTYSRKWSAIPENREKLRQAWREYDDKMRAANGHWKAEYHRKYRLRFPDKTKAHALVSYAIKKGNLIRRPCESRANHHSRRIEAHHDDYSKPFKVRWLCVIHHKQAHRPVTSASRLSHKMNHNKR